jgi:hypothetical protein
MRECGNTVNLWEIECLSNLNLIKDFKIIIFRIKLITSWNKININKNNKLTEKS